jgi:ATP-binding protein involved in chromosome partitioning
VRSIIAVASGKGGVGKSTVAANLAVALQDGGAHVGLLDADIYGPSQPGMLGSAGQAARAEGERLLPVHRHGVAFISMGLLTPEGAPLIWRAPLAMKIIQQFLSDVAWGELDYLLIDLPPGTGDVQLTLAQQAALSGAVIVTTPQRAALDVARKGLRMFSQVSVPILGVIENMSGFTCGHCGQTTDVFKEGGGRRMAQELDAPFLGALPLDPAIMMSSDDGEPVIARAPRSVAAQAVRDVATNLRAQIERAAAGDAGPEELALDAAGDLLVRWRDGHLGRHKPYSLRLACACAGCVDETTGERTLDAHSVPLDIAVSGVTPVGRYALAIGFTDGHRTGIYKHDLLRRICECPECAGKRSGAAAFEA